MSVELSELALPEAVREAYENMDGKTRGHYLGALIDEMREVRNDQYDQYFNTDDMGAPFKILAYQIAMLLKYELGSLETLQAMYHNGPLFDGSVPSKSERDVMCRYDLATKVIVEGEFGFNACTYIGGVIIQTWGSGGYGGDFDNIKIETWYRVQEQLTQLIKDHIEQYSHLDENFLTIFQFSSELTNNENREKLLGGRGGDLEEESEAADDDDDDDDDDDENEDQEESEEDEEREPEEESEEEKEDED